MAWRGKAWRGKARIKARRGVARQGGARQGPGCGGYAQQFPLKKRGVTKKPKQLKMYQKNYQVTLTGATDLIMHRDNITFGEKVRTWIKDPANKKISNAGDDRTPAWSWLSCLYISAGKVVIDADNIMSMLRDGGKKCSAPSGKGSMKCQTQSGIICNEIGWPLLVSGKGIDANALLKMDKELDFEVHEEAARKAGFVLFVKRARVGTSKHVRVRPRFEKWSATGTLTVVDPTINLQMLSTILTFAGNFCGIGDWRPSSPTPGQFGRFTAEIKEIK